MTKFVSLYSDGGFKGTIVNPTCHFLNRWSREITPTVPLNARPECSGWLGSFSHVYNKLHDILGL